MQYKVYLISEASPEIGLGHWMRVNAIYEMLCHDFDTTFILQPSQRNFLMNHIGENLPIIWEQEKETWNRFNQLPPSAVVFFDGYKFGFEFQKKLGSFQFKSIIIDDFAIGRFCSNAVINHADILAEAYLKKAKTKVYTGFNYLMLRKTFFYPSNLIQPTDFSLLICFGGSNSTNLKSLIRTIESIEGLDTIDVITNQQGYLDLTQMKVNKDIKIFKNLSSEEVKQKIQTSEIVLCQSSTFALECFVLNKKIIIVKTEENQKLIYQSLNKQENVRGIPNIESITQNLLSELIFELNQIKAPQRKFIYPRQKLKQLIQDL